MQHLTFSQINKQQLIDIRFQTDFHQGHLPHSINLTLKNFKRFANDLIEDLPPIVFIADDETIGQLKQCAELCNDYQLLHVDGYILYEEIPKIFLNTSKTISAADFLELHTDYLLLDVRDQATVTIPAPEKNLLTRTVHELVSEPLPFTKEDQLFTLCGSGNSATCAASYLNNLGYLATVIEGGAKAINRELEKRKTTL